MFEQSVMFSLISPVISYIITNCIKIIDSSENKEYEDKLRKALYKACENFYKEYGDSNNSFLLVKENWDIIVDSLRFDKPKLTPEMLSSRSESFTNTALNDLIRFIDNAIAEDIILHDLFKRKELYQNSTKTRADVKDMKADVKDMKADVKDMKEIVQRDKSNQHNSCEKPQRNPKTNEIDSLSLVWIPSGTFSMGAVSGDEDTYPDERPQHLVSITQGFWMAQTPVTVMAFEKFCKATSRAMPPCPDFNPDWMKKDHPIVRVTWQEASEYCSWVGGRLPTEAEWEYAARGGRKQETKYYCGETITKNFANYSAAGTTSVGQYPKNGFNLFDMVGNVCEWVSDWYDGDYYDKDFSKRQPIVDPQGPSLSDCAIDPSKAGKVLRGPSWYYIKYDMRSSRRLKFDPTERDFSNGFRYVLPPDSM